MLSKSSHQRNTENKGSDSLDIRKKTNTLKKKYGTNDPFDIAKYLGIKVIFEPLGSISGYYNKQLRMKQIHKNHDLSDHDQLFTCAHELGHAIMYPDANTPFLRKRTWLLISKIELEADKFAIELLIDAEIFLKFQEFTTNQIARALGYNEELIKLRLKELKRKLNGVPVKRLLQLSQNLEKLLLKIWNYLYYRKS